MSIYIYLYNSDKLREKYGDERKSNDIYKNVSVGGPIHCSFKEGYRKTVPQNQVNRAICKEKTKKFMKLLLLYTEENISF